MNLSVGNLTASTTVVACLAGGGACPQFLVQPVSAADLKLHVISGDGQVLTSGTQAQPLVLQVTDSAVPSNPVSGAAVQFTETVLADTGLPSCPPPEGICQPLDPKILYNSVSLVPSDLNGMATFIPAIQARWGAARALIGAAVGTSAAQMIEIRILAPPN